MLINLVFLHLFSLFSFISIIFILLRERESGSSDVLFGFAKYTGGVEGRSPFFDGLIRSCCQVIGTVLQVLGSSSWMGNNECEKVLQSFDSFNLN